LENLIAMFHTLRALALGALALAGASVLNFRLAAQIQSRPYDVAHVPKGSFMRLASLGQRGLVSDLYWLETVQYVGDARADTRGYDKLFPLVDLVTDLDPRHGYAYQTGGIVLSAAGRLEESDRILEKGMEKGPPWWSFPFYVAFNHFFYRGDYAAAARYAEIAARRPGASPNISHLAVSLASKSGSPDQAVALIEELRRSVADEASAARLDEQLKLAILERDAQLLEAALARFREDRGWDISALEDLVGMGYLKEIPSDPHGGHYVWNPADRKVRSSANPFRFQLKEGPHSPRFEHKPTLPAPERTPP
jgi:tetratricopeptide (TPR) repeat protein